TQTGQRKPVGGGGERHVRRCDRDVWEVPESALQAHEGETRTVKARRPDTSEAIVLHVGCSSRRAAAGPHRVKTVFPCVRPSHIARKPSTAPSIGKPQSISGSIPARATRRTTSPISSCVPLTEPVIVSWSARTGSTRT